MVRIRLVIPAIAAVLASLLASCVSLGPQPSYLARNDHRVFQRPDGGFEVLARPGTSGRRYFCAAGDYARVMRNASPAQRVVVTAPDGPTGTVPGGRSMVFEIAPPGPRTLPPVTVVPMNRRGASLSVAAAQAQCKSGRTFGHTLAL